MVFKPKQRLDSKDSNEVYYRKNYRNKNITFKNILT